METTSKRLRQQYSSGYGQARADAIARIEEAMRYVVGSMAGGIEGKVSEEDMQRLHARHEALMWTRALLCGMKPSRKHREADEELGQCSVGEPPP